MGIIKVAETRDKVAEISLELEKKKVLVAQLQRECEEFLAKIVEQKNSASERERVGYLSTCSLAGSYRSFCSQQVQAFGARIGDDEIRCQTIATAAHEELAEAEPLLIKANEALEQLTKRDIGEVKAYVHPPSAVEKVMKALMILSTFIVLNPYTPRLPSRGQRRHLGRGEEGFGQRGLHQNTHGEFPSYLLLTFDAAFRNSRKTTSPIASFAVCNRSSMTAN